MSDATVALTAENFEKTVTSGDIVLVDFWASWCGPCMRFAPIFEQAADKYDDITFAKLDTEAERDVAASLEITSIPTIMAFKKGNLVFRQAGALNTKQLDSLIEQVRDFDVDAAAK